MTHFFQPSIPNFCCSEWRLGREIKDLPDSPGLYAIYSTNDLEQCLYVGKSESSIKSRIASIQHKPWLTAKATFPSPVVLYRIMPLADRREICLEECLAIGILRPLWNCGDVDWTNDKIIKKEREKRFKASMRSRRTALTVMSDGGIPLRHIQSISGHKTLSALERYLEVSDEQKRQAIAKLIF